MVDRPSSAGMRIWGYINILSIDIALGAMGGCLLFAGLFDVSLRPPAYLGLGLIVWIIYTVDHLLDASRPDTRLSTARHRFHHVHRNALTLAVILASLVVLAQSLFVRTPVLVSGFLMGGWVIVYLTIQSRLRFMKELAAAVSYTAGVVIAPLSLLDRPVSAPEWVTVVAFFLTTWINLLICSLYDHAADLKDHQPSFATTFGAAVTRQTTFVLFVTVFALLVYLFLSPGSNRLVAGLLALMNLTLAVVVSSRSWFAQADRHRLFADLAFLFPLLYLILDGSPWI